MSSMVERVEEDDVGRVSRGVGANGRRCRDTTPPRSRHAAEARPPAGADPPITGPVAGPKPPRPTISSPIFASPAAGEMTCSLLLLLLLLHFSFPLSLFSFKGFGCLWVGLFPWFGSLRL